MYRIFLKNYFQQQLMVEKFKIFERFLKDFFLNIGPPKESIFLTTAAVSFRDAAPT